MAATKLKRLSVTSVDLVDQGANPDAHIRLFKRKGEQPEEKSDPDMGLFKKFLYWLAKGFQDATGNEPTGEQETGGDGGESVTKDAQTFLDNLSREVMEQVTREMHDCTYALADSLCSILCDNSLTADTKKGMMLQSMDEFNDTVRGAIADWAEGKKMQTDPAPEAGIQKSQAQLQELEAILKGNGIAEPENDTHKEVTETMKIDKSKMTPEEQATLAEFEKKYGVADTEPNGGEEGAEDGVEKGAGEQDANLHPEVAKALADFQELTKKQTAEVEELKKSLEIERLTAVAKKYEPLGKKSDELAGKLYELKKAGGTVYDDYVALLDENLEALNKSGLFQEIGSNREGSAGTAQTLGIKAAEIAKGTQGMTSMEAIVKAFEENPELAEQYEREYMGR